MSDDKMKRAPQDAGRINLSEDVEVAYWTDTLSVTEQQLKDAVHEVGSGADAVKRRLNRV